MKKSFLIATLFVGFFVDILAQDLDIEYWNGKILPNIYKDKISFVMESYQYSKSDNELYKIDSAFVYSTETATFIEKEYNLAKISDDSIFYANITYANIVTGPRHIGSEHVSYSYEDKILASVQNYANFYISPYKNQKLPTKSLLCTTDSTIDSNRYLIIKYVTQIFRNFNTITQDFDILVHDTVRVYCNKKTFWVDKIDICKSTDPSIYRIYNFSKIDTSSINDTNYISKFNSGNPAYGDFGFYILPKEPSSEIGIWTENTQLNDSILNFPLVNIKHDTSYLKDVRGWILLDFWNFGCGPCARFHQALKDEKEKFGHRIFEKEGIQIFCINHRGGDSPIFQKYVSTFDISDITYCARDFNFLQIYSNPTFYLFAPNGDLVYYNVGLNDGDYEKCLKKILKAKRRYERRHKITKQ